MGLAPGFLPGRTTLDAGPLVRRAWGTVPASAASTPPACSQAAADGQAPGARAARRRPAGGLPRPRPGRAGPSPGAGSVIAVDGFLTVVGQQADVVLPAAGYAEDAAPPPTSRAGSARVAPEGHPSGPHCRLDHRRGAGRPPRPRPRPRHPRRDRTRSRRRPATPASRRPARAGRPRRRPRPRSGAEPAVAADAARRRPPSRRRAPIDRPSRERRGRRGAGVGGRGRRGRGRGAGAAADRSGSPRRRPGARRPTPTVSASWPPARSTTPARRAARPRSPGCAGATALQLHPSDLTASASPPAPTVTRHRRPAATVTLPVERRPPACPRRRAGVVNQPAPTLGDLVDSRRRHRPPGGDGMTPSSPLDPLSPAASASPSCSSSILQGRRRLRAPARRRDVDDLVRAQAPSPTCRTDRPQQRRAVRHPPDPRRRHQALLQGGPACPSGPTAGSSASPPTCRSCPPSSCSPSSRSAATSPRKHGSSSIFGHDTCLQVADPPIGILLLPGLSGDRGLRRDARRLVVGLEVPAARLGAGLGADGHLRGGARAVGRRGRAARRLAVHPRHRDARPATASAASSRDWNLVVTGFVPVRHLRHRRHGRANRPPFDLVEAEQELVGGFHTEYSSIRFALFFLAEFMNMVTMSAIIVTLFFGGPAGPTFFGPDWIWGPSGSSPSCSSSSSSSCGSGPRCPACATTSYGPGLEGPIPLALGWLLLLGRREHHRRRGLERRPWSSPSASSSWSAASCCSSAPSRTAQRRRDATDDEEVEV